MSIPTPLPYHYAIRDILKEMDAKVWDWFGQQQHSPEALEALKFDLLKSTYRLTPAAHAALYAAAQFAAEALEITAPITLYQAQASTDTQRNAWLAMGCDEIHIVLSGDLEKLLSESELRALLGHELGHHLLHNTDQGDHLRSWDILRSISLESHPHPAFMHAQRNLSLYTEVYCDQAALHVVGELPPVISTLIKMETGVTNVAPEEFLAQAHEILSRSPEASQAITHPEPYIRAAALDMSHRQDASLQEKLASAIEGPADTAQLDLLRQKELSKLTRALLSHALTPGAMRSDLMLSHAKLFFDDFHSKECGPAAPSQIALTQHSPWNTDSVTNYLCYVLLDVATADRNLDELPIASVLDTAETWGFKEQLIPMLRKELKLRKNQIEQCDREKAKILRGQA